MRSIKTSFVLLLSVLALFAGPAAAQASRGPERTAPWDEEIIDRFEVLAVQHAGRVKPLDTYAGFQLLRFNGRRKVETPDGEKLGPTAWILDVFFFPDQARTYECFILDNDEVLVAVGATVPEKEKRDRYSYNELLPARDALFDKARTLVHKEEKDLSVVERQTRDLAINVRDFEELLLLFEFARAEFRVDGSPGLRSLWEGQTTITTSELLEAAPGIGDLMQALPETPTDASRADYDAMSTLLSELEYLVLAGERALAFLPPKATVEDAPEWLNPGEAIMALFTSEPEVEGLLDVFRDAEAMAQNPNDASSFDSFSASMHEDLTLRAEARGEYSQVPREVSFYRGDYFFRALLLFLLGFVLMAITWLKPMRWLDRGVWAVLLLGTMLLTKGIVDRCIIQSRPPVTTLYETILFITGVAVIVCMIIEALNRQRLALATATVLGALGMFLAGKYELREAATAGDSMPSLVAVLDTNFWLATHVTTVTIGYAAGLLASAIAHVWLFGKIFGWRRTDRRHHKDIARMVYGVLCFGLFFSVVGTILGGIWANYSWGRFWGWDPKENGALLICLWELLILHARMGGYIRDFGLCMMAIIGGCVVAFSWWGVNLLGVGLHSYGFTDGVGGVLNLTYMLEAGVLAVGGLWWLFMRSMAKAEPGAASDALQG